MMVEEEEEQNVHSYQGEEREVEEEGCASG